MKKYIDYKKDVEKVKRLYISGIGITSACKSAEMSLPTFKSLITEKEYQQLKIMREQNKKQAKQAKIEKIFKTLLKDIERGKTLTETVEKNGIYLNDLYNNTTIEQKKRLARSKYIGELERINHKSIR